MRRLLRGFAIGVVVWLLGSITAHAEIKIGVQAYRGEKEALERWGELGKHMSCGGLVPVLHTRGNVDLPGLDACTKTSIWDTHGHILCWPQVWMPEHALASGS